MPSLRARRRAWSGAAPEPPAGGPPPLTDGARAPREGADRGRDEQSRAGTIAPGSSAFLRANVGIFAGGFAIFALLYAVQPLLPAFSAEFRVSPAESSLALSLTTGALAIFLLLASAVSESWGRKPMMVGSVFASAILGLATAALPDWHEILAARALMGVALSGLPAVAMAYVDEEMEPHAIGLAMGLFVAANGFGGMTGRLLSGVLADFLGWRAGLAILALLGLAAGLLMAFTLPPSRHFTPRPLRAGVLLAAYRSHLTDRSLHWLFPAGFLLMGGFVTIYNYIPYRLMAPPFSLSQAAVGLIFGVYLAGMAGSTWMGGLAAKLPRPRLFRVSLFIDLAGIILTLSFQLRFVLLGLVLLTFGFFAAHSVASSWVGVKARHTRAQASALYLLFYYLGSSLVGSAGGVFLSAWGWDGVVGLTAGLVVLAVLLGLYLARLEGREREAAS